MSILFDQSNKLFHLSGGDTSYVLRIDNYGNIAHVYWGKKINHLNPNYLIREIERSSFSPTPDENNPNYSLDSLPQEYPSYGSSDFRHPAFQIQYENGSTLTSLRYTKHTIYQGKPKLEGLPSTYHEKDNEVTTLDIELIDSLTNVKVILTYCVFEEKDVITRSVKFINESTENIKLLRALSACVDFKDKDYEMINLHGYWAKERHLNRQPLTMGTMSIGSSRGSSSHNQNPFLALVRKNTNEDSGDAYGFNFVYSGNFIASAEVSQLMTTRVSMGINDFDFSWLLEPKEEFQAPEVVMVYSSEGLGKMSRTYHDLYRTRLCRGQFRDKERPILINNWEATYFDFNAAKLETLATSASKLGIELFVLDDGWFSKRNSDKTSLGDWFVDKNKLPGGLEEVASKVNNLGMQFGLWFEPEMISPESELYKNHPDWCIHVEGRNRTQGRNQLILDFSSKEVCEYILNMISKVLESIPVEYVKWDMNRNMTEIGSKFLPSNRQRETAHRYMLGLYDVLEKITTSFPNILFESCSGGGGRFDPGMLYYMPQTWTSDNTDAIERLKIQYGTSLVYPPISMGAHVSAVPNHQVNRTTSIKTRGDVAMAGNFGYELDLGQISKDETTSIKEQVAFYKKIRNTIQFGDFYRLKNPFEGNETGWMFVSKDKKEAIVSYFEVLASTNPPIKSLNLKGLNPDYLYSVEGSEEVLGGDMLMYAGINIPLIYEDFYSKIWVLRARD